MAELADFLPPRGEGTTGRDAVKREVPAARLASQGSAAGGGTVTTRHRQLSS